MSLRDWFKARPKSAPAAAPSDSYPTPFDAIAALIREYRAGDEDGWISFEGTLGKQKVLVQFSGDVVNFCATDVALPSLLKGIGLEQLAASAGPGGHPEDRTIWSVPGASAEELAAVIHEAFVTVLGLAEGYTLVGSRDQ